MSLVPVKFPLDLTGAAASNRVTDETHQLASTNIRLFVPRYGAFFSDSVVVRDAATNRTLVRGVDYYPGVLYTLPTEQTGREIHQIIVITDASCGPNVLFDAQMLGGEYSYSYLDGRPIEFDNLIGKPDGYNPAPHLHDAGDVYGFEFLTASLDRVRDAILLGSTSGAKGLYDYVNAKMAELQITLNLIMALRSNTKSITDALGYTPLNVAGGTVTGPLVLQSFLYRQANTRDRIKPTAATSSSTTLDLSLSNMFTLNLNSDTTLKFDVSKITGLAAGDAIKFSMLVRNDAVAGRKLLFPASVMWSNKIEPGRSTLANAVNEYEFRTYDGGVSWVGTLLGANIGVPG
jgi:hypothetical protein